MFTCIRKDQAIRVGSGKGSVTFAHLTHIIPTRLRALWALAKLVIIFREIRCM